MTGIQHLPTPHSYSTAVAAGDQVFLALHRGFGERFAEQFDSTMDSLAHTLAQFDLTLASLVKVAVWLKQVQDLPEMEQRFRQYFEPDRFPARMTATTEFIDDDCLLMIEGVAYRES
jgi:2-iminobutanoate/2-iminopropanoate deaminase